MSSALNDQNMREVCDGDFDTLTSNSDSTMTNHINSEGQNDYDDNPKNSP